MKSNLETSSELTLTHTAGSTDCAYSPLPFRKENTFSVSMFVTPVHIAVPGKAPGGEAVAKMDQTRNISQVMSALSVAPKEQHFVVGPTTDLTETPKPLLIAPFPMDKEKYRRWQFGGVDDVEQAMFADRSSAGRLLASSLIGRHLNTNTTPVTVVGK